MIRDGDCDFALAGGVDTCIMPEIIHGFANMNATIKIVEGDRAFSDAAQASRPFSIDRRGMVLSEGGGVLVLAAEEMLSRYGLSPRAEVLGVGWTSDAHHFTLPNPDTIVRAVGDAIQDAGVSPGDIQYINAHGTSTPKGDRIEIECLRNRVWERPSKEFPFRPTNPRSAIPWGLRLPSRRLWALKGCVRGLILPTVNHIPDPALADVDVVPNMARRQPYNLFLSNAFGFGGHQLLYRVQGGVKGMLS